MEPKSDSVIIAIADNKGRGPSPSPAHEIVPHHDEQSTDDHVGAAAATATPTAAEVAAAVNNYKKKRSGRGAMHILQVAMVMLRRRRSTGKSKPASLQADQSMASSKGTWKRLVGSIRPLHLQGSSPMSVSVADLPVASNERYEDVLSQPKSPVKIDDLASEDGMTSRYTSAVNLQELDRPTEDNDNANAPASSEHTVNIDAKAEEFIAQFYQQMRLQRSDSIIV